MVTVGGGELDDAAVVMACAGCNLSFHAQTSHELKHIKKWRVYTM